MAADVRDMIEAACRKHVLFSSLATAELFAVVGSLRASTSSAIRIHAAYASRHGAGTRLAHEGSRLARRSARRARGHGDRRRHCRRQFLCRGERQVRCLPQKRRRQGCQALRPGRLFWCAALPPVLDFVRVTRGPLVATCPGHRPTATSASIRNSTFLLLPGELALLYNTPRAATVRCVASGTLWALERSKFRAALVESKASEEDTLIDFLHSIEIVSTHSLVGVNSCGRCV